MAALMLTTPPAPNSLLSAPSALLVPRPFAAFIPLWHQLHELINGLLPGCLLYGSLFSTTAFLIICLCLVALSKYSSSSAASKAQNAWSVLAHSQPHILVLKTVNELVLDRTLYMLGVGVPRHLTNE